MLDQLLEEIREGGTINLAELALRCQVSPALIEMMLEDLEKRGLIVIQRPTSCSEACGGCPLVNGCSKNNIVRSVRLAGG